MKTIKSKLMLVSLVIMVSVFMGACSYCDTDSESAKHEQNQIVKQYTCAMHPEIVQDEPGKCPECAMDLVEKTDAHSE